MINKRNQFLDSAPDTAHLLQRVLHWQKISLHITFPDFHARITNTSRLSPTVKAIGWIIGGKLLQDNQQHHDSQCAKGTHVHRLHSGG